MTKTLLLALGLGLTLATGASVAAASPASLTTAPAALVPMDLTKFGAPLTLQVPEGTTATLDKGSYGPPSIVLASPGYRMVIMMFSPPTVTAKDKIDAEASYVGDGKKVVLREPTVFRTKATEEYTQDGFGLAIDNPATGYTYYLSSEAPITEPFTPAQVDAMLASARTVKLTGAPAKVAPAKAAPAKKPVR